MRAPRIGDMLVKLYGYGPETKPKSFRVLDVAVSGVCVIVRDELGMWRTVGSIHDRKFLPSPRVRMVTE